MGARRDPAPIFCGDVENDGPFPGHVAGTEHSHDPGARHAPVKHRDVEVTNKLFLGVFWGKKIYVSGEWGCALVLESNPKASLAINTLVGTWRVGARAGVHYCRLQSQLCLLV